MRIAINVTPAELADPSFACDLGRFRLRSWGVKLSIDDFGTGESTLLRLHQLEFNEIKIDRAFTSGVANSRAGRHIVRFATDLAHELEMTVVTEGVETEREFEVMHDLGVDLLQGYHVGRAGTPESLLHRLATC